MKPKKKTFKTKKDKVLPTVGASPLRKISIKDIYLVLIFLLFFSLLLFYPGDGTYFKLFAYDKKNLVKKDSKTQVSEIVIPRIRDENYPIFLTAHGVYAIDFESATPLYAKNQNDRLYPASTTKIITALTAIKVFDMDQVLTVRRTIEEGQVVGILAGEKFTFEDLLYALLVHSGNDAAYAIADNFPGGYDEFIVKMNQTAQELKMDNSRFTNPAGLDNIGQYTTAFDLTLSARKLLENKVLSRIVSTKSITISDVGFNKFYPLTNVNKLLGEIPGLGGLKTGFTENAKENLVSFYSRYGRKYVLVILKSDDRFEDTKSLLNWLNSNVEYKKYSL